MDSISSNNNNNREGKGEGGVFVMRRRAEIDTRPPFKSVKEAVMLFGETVLAAELNSSSSSNKLKLQKQDVTIKHGHGHGHGHGPSMIGAKTTELQNTKQSLYLAREESMLMANCLISLKQELEDTKRELQQIKATRDFEKQQSINPDIEYLKFVENVMEVGTETPSAATNNDEEEQEAMEFQNKPCVKFANPPAFVHVINTEEGYEVLAADSRHPSSMKQNKKKKLITLIPLIGGIFSKKKGLQKGASPK